MRTLPLLGRFALTSFLVVGLIGAVFSLNTRREIRSRELRTAEGSAELLVDYGIEPLLANAGVDAAALADDQDPALAAAADALAALLADRDEIVTLATIDGDVVVSSPVGAGVVPALASDDVDEVVGRRWTTVATDMEEWLHVQVPLRDPTGAVIGRAVVTQELAPVLATIRSQVVREVSILVVGMLLLFGLLYRSVATASRALRRHAAERDYAALHDGLTGLPNRTLLTARADAALAQGGEPGHECALLLLDLDRFRDINETLGHPAGDALLCAVAERLSATLDEHATLARLGGDEFAVLLPSLDGVAAASAVADRLARALHEPFMLDGVEVSVGTSIGIACSSTTDDATADLLRQADVALYEAKEEGREITTFDPTSTSSMDIDRLALLGGLRRAIEEDQLVLHYQPQLSLTSGRIAGVEALVRWQHPTRGLLGPGAFIDLAEQSGLMAPMTTWVLETSLAQLGEWDRRGLDLAIAVNVSPRTLVESGLAARIVTSLARWDVDPARLELEITEHELVEGYEQVNETLGRLRSVGVRVAIDDFGTGYSSLSYLTGLPVDVLKIDRSLVASLEEDQAQATVLRSVCELGHALGLLVVAEGVEQDSTLPALHRLGVDLAQGYALWRPAPADEITAMLLSADRPAPTGAQRVGLPPPPPLPDSGAQGRAKEPSRPTLAGTAEG